jgi:N-methylhydantoinase A
VGAPLGLDGLQAAEAILRVANSRMAGAIRLVSIERGFDPKRFAFMPFGGGGALHACAMLADVGLARAIVPRYPGVTSAMGCVIADMRHDFVQTVNSLLDGLDTDDLGALMQSHLDRGHGLLDASKTTFGRRDEVFELDMAYVGQTHTVSVPLPVAVENGRVTPPTPAAIAEAFDATYRASYGRLLDKGARRVMNLRTAVIGRRPKFDLATLAPEGGTVEAARKGTRRAHFGDAWHETAIYARLELPVGARIDGPAILEQPDTTILVEPGFSGTVDTFGNVIIEASEAST